MWRKKRSRGNKKNTCGTRRNHHGCLYQCVELTRVFQRRHWHFLQILLEDTFSNHYMFCKGTVLKRNRLSESVPSASKPVQWEAGTKGGFLCYFHVHGSISVLWAGSRVWLTSQWIWGIPVPWVSSMIPGTCYSSVREVLKERRMEGSRTTPLYNRLLADILKLKPSYHSRNNCSKELETYLVQIGKKPWKISFFHLCF